MKKSLIFLAVIFALILILLITANIIYKYEETGIKVYLDDKEVLLYQEPIIKDGILMIPIRKISETLGARVKWIKSNEEVVIDNGFNELKLKIKDKQCYLNNKLVELDVTPKIKFLTNTTVVPLKIVEDTLMLKSSFDEKEKTLKLYTKWSQEKLNNSNKERLRNALLNFKVKEIEGQLIRHRIEQVQDYKYAEYLLTELERKEQEEYLETDSINYEGKIKMFNYVNRMEESEYEENIKVIDNTLFAFIEDESGNTNWYRVMKFENKQDTKLFDSFRSMYGYSILINFIDETNVYKAIIDGKEITKYVLYTEMPEKTLLKELYLNYLNIIKINDLTIEVYINNNNELILDKVIYKADIPGIEDKEVLHTTVTIGTKIDRKHLDIEEPEEYIQYESNEDL